MLLRSTSFYATKLFCYRHYMYEVFLYVFSNKKNIKIFQLRVFFSNIRFNVNLFVDHAILDGVTIYIMSIINFSVNCIYTSIIFPRKD